MMGQTFCPKFMIKVQITLRINNLCFR